MPNESDKPYEYVPGYIGGEKIEHLVIMDMPDTDSVSYIYSPTMYPPLEVTTNGVTRLIDVVFVSSEIEDKKLLHHLLTATRATDQSS